MFLNTFFLFNAKCDFSYAKLILVKSSNKAKVVFIYFQSFHLIQKLINNVPMCFKNLSFALKTAS